jgi:hypothetical protein
MEPPHTVEVFQACGACKRTWPSWDAFAADPAGRLRSLQAVIHLSDVNLLVFEHDCGSSVSVLSRRLRHLLPAAGPDSPAVRLLKTEQCRGHCLVLGDMAMCDAPCSNARDRELIRLVLRMKKDAAA